MGSVTAPERARGTVEMARLTFGAEYLGFEQWQEDGLLDAAQRDNAIWKRMLAEYEAPPLDPAIDEALLEFIARRKASMPDSEV